jgi:RNA polymerase sigma-70 factor (ECF subfamily)
MERLVEEVLQGKRGAATRFYHAFAPKVRRYLQAKLADEAVEEILQDTFLSAFDSLPLYKGEAQVTTWLISIARHEVADYYRKRAVRRAVEQTSPLFEGMVSDLLSPEFVYYQDRLRGRFMAAYHSLSRTYQDILSYRYELSLSVKEIATRMDLTPKATESLLYRARMAFVAAYEERA